jgi:segregation and condensation protein A
VEDEEDLALLEARDLLFARLLQYRAYKQIAGALGASMAAESRRFPRAVGMEPRFGELLPEVLIGLGLDEFAKLAAHALRPKPEPVLSLAHIHAPRVSVREQAAVLVDRLRRVRSTTFRSLVSDSPNLVTTVARFLALLELYREGAVAFEQAEALAELTIRWSGTDEGEIAVGDEFDEGDVTLRPVDDVADEASEASDGDGAGEGDVHGAGEASELPHAGGAGEVGEASERSEPGELDGSDETGETRDDG